ncbi:hypothetical protein EVA_16330 [gut metagenome]|uniref:Uncharacterized protein n=1 Tax=gut metagenome TaxID=749906 RepID=J9G197_9ZZZZ
MLPTTARNTMTSLLRFIPPAIRTPLCCRNIFPVMTATCGY